MSIELTLLEKAVIPSTEQMQLFEDRVPKENIIQAFREGTDSLVNTESYMNAKVSKRRPVEIAVWKKEDYNIMTTRVKEPTPNIATSAKVPLSFSTVGFSFQIAPPLNEDNYFSDVQEFQRNLFNGIMTAMFEHPTNALEVKLATFLEANKATSLAAPQVGGVTAGTGQYEMAADQFIIKAPVVMRANRLYPRFGDIHNIGAIARQREIATYGRANTRNLDQYQTEMDYYPSQEIDVAVGDLETHFLYQKGQLGLLNWVEWDARNNSVVHDGRFTTIVDPFFGFSWGVFIKRDRADISAVGGTGLERASNIRYDFFTDFGAFTSYSSTAGKSPIIKFALKES